MAGKHRKEPGFEAGKRTKKPHAANGWSSKRPAETEDSDAKLPPRGTVNFGEHDSDKTRKPK